MSIEDRLDIALKLSGVGGTWVSNTADRLWRKVSKKLDMALGMVMAVVVSPLILIGWLVGRKK